MAQIGRVKRLKYAKKYIEKFFNDCTIKIHTFSSLSVILADNKETWLLAKVTNTVNFIDFLEEEKIISEVLKIKLKYGDHTIFRYITGEYQDYEIALSIYPGSYLCHYTAVFIHGLTDNIPKKIYVNKEQSEKPKNDKNSLSQESIDRAFSGAMRKTNRIASYNDIEILMLNSKNTGNSGVVKIDDLLVSSLERTLIDIVVRPIYSGGISEVLEAYKNAIGKISINILLSILKQLDYTYPYHQCIGFYLEKAGYKKTVLNLVKKIPMEFDFYLSYQIKNPLYSKEWKLYYPGGI